MPAQGKKQKGGAGGQKKPGTNGTAASKAGGQAKVVQKVSVRGEAKPQPKPVKAAASNEPKVQVEQLIKEGCENEDMIEEFVCRICLVSIVGCSPKMTSCSHLFCGDCMEQWIGSHQTNQTWAQRAQLAGSERSAPCPVCKTQLHEVDDLFPVSPSGTSDSAMLWQMLSALKMKCANHETVRPDGKCCWTGTYGSYKDHILACKNEAVPEVPEVPEVSASAQCSCSDDEFDDQCNSQPEHKSPQAAPSPDPQVSDVLALGPTRDAWDDSDTDSDDAAANAPTCDVIVPLPSSPSKGGEAMVKEKAVSDHSIESTEASLVTDEPLAGESSEASETESPGVPEHSPEAQPTPIGISCPGAVVPKDVVEDAMSDLVQSIRSLMEISLQEVGKGAPNVQQAPAAVAHAPVAERKDVCKVKVAHPFQGDTETSLSLKAGDFVEVLEQHSSGWTYGRKCSEGQQGAEGWFPRWATGI